MSNTVKKFSKDLIPYYIFFQQATPTTTLRQLADCYTHVSKRPLDRYECLGKIHQEGLIEDIVNKIRNNQEYDLYQRGRIIFAFPVNTRLTTFMNSIVTNMLPVHEPALKPIDSSGLEFEVSRGNFLYNKEVDRGAALVVYERGFMYSYRGSVLWLLPLTSQKAPFIKLGGRDWIPFLLVSGSLRIVNLGVTIKVIKNLESPSIYFTSYQPAGIALVGTNDDLYGIEIRLYGPRQITKRVKTLTIAFSSLIRHATEEENILTGYDIANSLGPNRLAKLLYNQVKKRNGIAVMLRISGIKYRIIAYGGILGLDSKVSRISAEEVAAKILNYKNPDELFNDLEAKGLPQITFFSLRLPRENVNLDIIANSVPAEARSAAVTNSTYNYVGVNTINLSMYTYSKMSENKIKGEIKSLLAEPLKHAASTLASIQEEATSEA